MPPRVLAMQAPVTDHYAPELAHAFYENLSRPAWPRAGVALADARRHVENHRGVAGDGRGEWATSTLLLAGEDAPLLDNDLDLEPLRQAPVHAPTASAVPALDLGRLVGRRREVRRALRALRAEPTFTSEHGEVGGLVLTGIGGVGKSTIAGRVIARLSEQGWVCSATAGEWSLQAVCQQLEHDLSRTAHAWAVDLAGRLAAASEDEQRVAALRDALRQRVLLVFDNYEDNLTDDGRAFLDVPRADTLQTLIDAAATGKLLVTSRYPLPGTDGVYELAVGPLSLAEAHRLWLRLPALEQLAPQDRRLVDALIGGHPRTLELLDALLRRGASVAQIRPKLRALAAREHIDVRAERDLKSAITDATRLGARDIVLDTLLDALDPDERELLLQAAVSGLPTAVDDLANALPEVDVNRAARRLHELSLLVSTSDGVWVHRWTAEALHDRQPADDYRERCRRAGELRLARLSVGGVSVEEGIEATENFLSGADLDRAAEVGILVADLLEHSSASRRLSFAGRLRSALPTGRDDYKYFADHEAQGLLQLGFTAAALERYVELVHDHEERIAAEPDRADYQSDLSVSYDRHGGLLAALGQGEQARQRFIQSLEIRQRLAAAEPDRADYQHDLESIRSRLAGLNADLERRGVKGRFRRRLGRSSRAASGEGEVPRRG